MLPISIEKRRTLSPFFKFRLAEEMRTILEIILGGRICGCYILTISVEKQRKCSPFCFLNYFSRTDGRATRGADPNAIRNFCFVEADGVYFYCFSMIVHGFAKATTDTICVFLLF